MKTSVIGFPRIGKKRELKFSSESYFAGKATKDNLSKTAKEIRLYGWQKQKNAGIDFISSNDFSLYDAMLDTAFMLNAIPERFKNLELNNLDIYFAMAHGYQGIQGDVKALAMKKWFNTNYHYIVPEIDDSMVFSFSENKCKVITEFKEALLNGIITKPVLIGPYTFLHFAHYTGKKNRINFKEEIVQIYSRIIIALFSAGAKWIQVDEPALVLDMKNDDIIFFKSLYTKLFSIIHSKTNIAKILLQTYFGDVRDCWHTICSLDFAGIGLDFIEGKENLKLLSQEQPKENTLLFAGIINGKNIWKSKYSEVIEKLLEILKYIPKNNLVLNTSCSLLHVPYTIEQENKLLPDVKKYFAFAEEKLTELKDITELFTTILYKEQIAYIKNEALFNTARIQANTEIHHALKNLSEKDFIRKPSFSERENIQKEKFKLPLFPTTTIGSFPQTKEVRENRSAYKKGEKTLQEYKEFNFKKIKNCIKIQEQLGIDVLVHGEYERNDMVEYFGTHLEGFLFTHYGWVQSYGTRCVKPPIIWKDISRKQPITVNWAVYAQSCTKKIVKGMLTGPITILNWSFPREDISLKEQGFQIALAIRQEVLDLEKNGIQIIQIDEAALREKLPLRKKDWNLLYLDWAIPAFRLVHSGVKPDTQIHTHMCYSEFSDIIKDIDNMDADVITFEAARSDLSILDVLKKSHFKTAVGPGVYDIHSARIPSVQEIYQTVVKITEKIPLKKIWINPDCGLKTRSNTEAEKSLEHLVTAAKKLRQTFKEKNYANK